MTTTAQARAAALKWLLNLVGTVEGRNDTIFVWDDLYPEANGKNWAWCAAAVTDAYLQATGADLRRITWAYYCPYLVNAAQKAGAWKTTGGNPGDLVLFDWNDDGVADHVGISYPDPSSRFYRSVEGNTSRTGNGDDEGIWIRYRDRSDIHGWIDMDVLLTWMTRTGLWDGDAPEVETPAPVGQLVLDGNIGPKSTRRGQEIAGTAADSIISAQYSGDQAHIHAVTTIEIDDDDEWRSSFVRVLQDQLITAGHKLRRDGALGYNTIGAWQEELGVEADHELGPVTAKAAQAKFNEGTLF